MANGMIDIGRPNLDWVKVAEGQGVPAARAATADEFIEQFGRAAGERGLRLIEALPGQRQCGSVHASSENIAPLLARPIPGRD